MVSGRIGEALDRAPSPVVPGRERRHGNASMRTPTVKELPVQDHPHMLRVAIMEQSRNVGFCSKVKTKDLFKFTLKGKGSSKKKEKSNYFTPTIYRLQGD